MADTKIIDAAPVIAKLAERALQAKGRECSLLGEVIDLLRAAPALEPVKRGRWMPHMEEMEDFFGKPQLIQTGVMCSECGHYSCCGGNFCNSCGAQMDGGDEQ